MKKPALSFAGPAHTTRLVGLALLCLLAPVYSLLASSLPLAVTVSAIQPNRVADIVLLDRGFDAGLREGMVCRVARGTAAIAEVLLVEVRPASSAALIVSNVSKQSIRAGDTATIKILKT